ncbi:MAG TPA: selenide, water dikinase SelD [Sediminibacterium sp.]|uniref:selenide, water dikinase SelD n=1 Tax=Sediminibacterium sp. TaxID=1917865 RepID=UPI0008C52EB2|nr:selenide, water dikinase SelD [Sediminibacterium sp.]OHC86169.1 MAG: selenide, water dikinase SelD [Sphingobacteriia bacterium RIFOXYC2_FULL_35_18]OHC89682.1 MAG: selenide, water dikinase SelD [Sphingobacteriia bacterium RIFOXYD2_FULL_35_12]HLD54434.1 selenide, water dikinase SelD [Sediminibacterium sp.]
MSEVQLTQFSHGAGCGCKIAPAVLDSILQSEIAPSIFKELLVGNSSKDDAAVYDLGNGTALISTTDFFVPIVDDPYQFGRIAAANAISDVYAMGGKPIMALAILGWPVDKLSPEIARRVIEGGRSICEEAGIPLAGGHSVDTTEPIFGLSVNGIVTTDHLKKNNTAQIGDLLFLTKPLGVGILSTAQKRGQLEAPDLTILIHQLNQLNKVGQLLGAIKGVHAMTDVTGFGLIGHLMEMMEGSNTGALINYSQVPVINSAKQYLAKRLVPDATYRNWNAYSKQVGFEKGVDVMEAFSILPDPQTNGGLLFAVDPLAVEEVVPLLLMNGLENHIIPIGKVTEVTEKRIMVAP